MTGHVEETGQRGAGAKGRRQSRGRLRDTETGTNE